MHESAPRSGSPLVQLARLVPDASFAIARDLQRAAFGAVRLGTHWSAAVLGAVASAPVVAGPLGLVEDRVESLARHGSQQRQADVLRFGVVLQRAEPIVTGFLERIVALLPIDALLARVDVDGLVQRVDVNAIISRVDVDGLVAEVLSGIEIGDLIHDSTNSIASDVRDTVRSGAASVDGRLARIVDRIVRHGRERDLVVPGYAVPGVL
jgi:hypothetical protein